MNILPSFNVSLSTPPFPQLYLPGTLVPCFHWRAISVCSIRPSSEAETPRTLSLSACLMASTTRQTSTPAAIVVTGIGAALQEQHRQKDVHYQCRRHHGQGEQLLLCPGIQGEEEARHRPNEPCNSHSRSCHGGQGDCPGSNWQTDGGNANILGQMSQARWAVTGTIL